MEVEYVFMRGIDMDTTLIYSPPPPDSAELIPAQMFYDLMFADSPDSTPGGHLACETVAKWFETGSNGHVQMVPGTSRWDNYDLPGFLNHIENGYVVPWTVEYTLSQLQGFPSACIIWTSIVVPRLQAEGINVETDPYHTIVVVWMMDWNREAGNGLWPRATFNGLVCSIGAYYYEYGTGQSDLTMPGVIWHEMGHAICQFGDHYGGLGDNNFYDVMGHACYVAGGWCVPYYTTVDCHQHNWWPVDTVSSLVDEGQYVLAQGHSIYFQNPESCTYAGRERIYLSGIRETGSNAGVGFHGTRLIAWWKHPSQCNQHPFRSLIMIPADGSVWDNTDGDVYPWSGIDSVVVGDWFQGSEAPIGWRADSIRTVYDPATGDSAMAFTLTYVPPYPHFLIVDTLPPIGVMGSEWWPEIAVKNMGAATGPFSVSVTSEEPSMVPNFTLAYPDSVMWNETVVLTATEPVLIGNSMDYWGARIPLTLEFPMNTQLETVHLSMAPSPLWSGERFTGSEVYAADSNLLIVASAETLRTYDGDFNLLWQRSFSSSVICVAIGDVVGTSQGTKEVAALVQYGWVHLLSGDAGTPFDNWPEMAQEPAAPGVMMISDSGNQDYVAYVDGNLLRIFDSEGLAPNWQIRDFAELPIHPDAWCCLGSPVLGDSVTGVGFAFTTGLATNVDGRFFVTDGLGELVYPPQVPDADPNYGYGLPTAGDFNGDGFQEICFPFRNDSALGGVKVCAYSVALDSVEIGQTNSGSAVLTQGRIGATHGSPQDCQAKPIFCFSVPQTGRNYLSIGGIWPLPGITVGLGVSNHPAYLASMDVDFSVNNHIVVGMDRKIMMYSSNGLAFNPAHNPVVVEWREEQIVAGASSIIAQSDGQATLLTPVSDSANWTLDARVLPQGSQGADWQGWFANAQNTNCHTFSVTIPSCDSTDTVSVTLNRLDLNNATLRVNVCGHLDWQINGYNIWRADTSDGTFTLYSNLITQERAIWQLIPLNDSATTSFFYATVVYDTLMDGSGFWGSHDLELP